MKRNKRPRHQARPLTISMADLVGPVLLPDRQTAMPLPQSPATPLPRSPQMPRPPRSAREVLTLLAAATGLVLAGRPDAKVELLPGTPTTVLISSGGQARAAFVLPVSHAEACRALGRPVTPGPDPELDLLWHEEQVAREASHAS